jgi:hypothetical protein
MMTQEQRLDRLERIVKLMIKAGLRARREGRQQDEKINLLVNLHIENEERFAKFAEARNEQDEKINILLDSQIKTRSEQDEKFNILLNSQIKNDERLAKTEDKLAESQARSDRKFEELMKLIREDRNGKAQ